jgi:hypothetical protein
MKAFLEKAGLTALGMVVGLVMGTMLDWRCSDGGPPPPADQDTTVQHTPPIDPPPAVGVPVEKIKYIDDPRTLEILDSLREANADLDSVVHSLAAPTEEWHYVDQKVPALGDSSEVSMIKLAGHVIVETWPLEEFQIVTMDLDTLSIPQITVTVHETITKWKTPWEWMLGTIVLAFTLGAVLL